MSATRSSHVNRLRDKAGVIFGPEFTQGWFNTRFDRGSIDKLQDLLGAHATPKGKKYALLPPIFFPFPSRINKKDIFLNPALVGVSSSITRSLRSILIEHRY